MLNKPLVPQGVAHKTVVVDNMEQRFREWQERYLDVYAAQHMRGPMYLIIGPSRVGKTLLSRMIADHLRLPYVSLDSARHLWYEERDYDLRLSLRREFYKLFFSLTPSVVADGYDLLLKNPGRKDGKLYNTSEKDISILAEHCLKPHVRAHFVGCAEQDIDEKVDGILAYHKEYAGNCPLRGLSRDRITEKVRKIVRTSRELKVLSRYLGVPYYEVSVKDFAADLARISEEVRSRNVVLAGKRDDPEAPAVFKAIEVDDSALPTYNLKGTREVLGESAILGVKEGARTYIMTLPRISDLPGAMLIPGRKLHPQRLAARKGVARRGLKFKPSRRVLMTENRELFSDSFVREVEVNDNLLYLGDGSWAFSIKGQACRRDGAYYFLDLVSAQFGHGLVDTCSRLWPLVLGVIDPSEFDGFVGIGTHGIAEGEFPPWLNDMLSAAGVPSSKVIFPRRVTLFERLVVPKRISPYHGKAHPIFNLTMNTIGNYLSDSHISASDSKRMVFLSRSKLVNAKRDGLDDTQARLDDMFANLGFEIVHPQSLSLSEQVKLVRECRIIAGVVGSQMHLACFANQNKLDVIRVAPSFFAWNTDRHIADGTLGAIKFHDVVIEKEVVAGYTKDKSPWPLTQSELELVNKRIGAIMSAARNSW